MNRKIKQDIEEIKQQLNQILSGSIVAKANKCDFIESNLKSIKLEVSKIKPVFVDDRFGLTIEYKIAPVTIFFDEENIFPNETFKAINYLNLISFEDMAKVQKKMNDIIALQKNPK